MGGGSSKSSRRSYSPYSTSSRSPSFDTGYGYPPPHQYPAPSRPAALQQQHVKGRYSKIGDDFTSLDQVRNELANAGLESSNLIVGIDFTKSNEWTGKRSFNNRCLHQIGDSPNPYEQAISIIGRTLSSFDEDNLIPCFGFGDALTHDKDVFTFYPDERPCEGFEEALSRYRELVPRLNLAGPTSFAPIIEMGRTIVEQSGGQYHVLLIIADGQVTRSVDTPHGHLSPQENETIDAIVRASQYPLSIVLVGVGDGPWDMMKEFDDNIPARAFDNFQFVNFTNIMSQNISSHKKEAEFALAALMEIPSQYKATIGLDILGRRRGISPERVALPPRLKNDSRSSYNSKPSQSNTSQKTAPSYSDYDSFNPTFQAATPFKDQDCPVCWSNSKDMAFGCGHQRSSCYENKAFLDHHLHYQTSEREKKLNMESEESSYVGDLKFSHISNLLLVQLPFVFIVVISSPFPGGKFMLVMM